MNRNYIRKIISIILSAVMLTSILPIGVTVVFAQENKTSEYSWKVISEEDKTAELNRYYGTDTDVIIPSEINGYKIISIPSRLFSSGNQVKSVTIPDSITNLTAHLFRICPYIKTIKVSENNVAYKDIDGVLFDKVGTNLIKYPNARIGEYTIPNTVEHIGEYAFNECGGLTNVEIPNSVVDIGTEGFCGCKSLEKIIIPDSVQVIFNRAFWECSSMTEVSIGKGVIGMSANVFGNCSSLTAINIDEDNAALADIDGVMVNKEKTELITCPAGKKDYYAVPESITTIKEYAFYKCEKLTRISLRDDITSIEWYAFYGCINISMMRIPKNITIINSNILAECKSLKEIFLNDSLTIIGSEAFKGCSNLKIVNFGKKIDFIGDQAFNNCTMLTNVTIPENITSIGNMAFGYDENGKTTDFTIHGKEGSVAETYSIDNGFNFVPVTEQFDLAIGETYYFDLSAEKDNIGTVNTAIPDTSLHFVPFTYTGTINAYVLDGTGEDQDLSDLATPYYHSLFVANYNIGHTVSWNELNDSSLIFGKIFEKNFKLRSISMGSKTDIGFNNSMCGLPSNNEWDTILVKANTIDNSLEWIKNWSDEFSLGQDTFSTDMGKRTMRGGSFDYYYDIAYVNDRNPDIGFRPALEVLNAEKLGVDGLKKVSLNLNDGALNNSKSNINIVCAGDVFTAPSEVGLTRPVENIGTGFYWLGSDNKVYMAGADVPSSVTSLTAQWETSEEHALSDWKSDGTNHWKECEKADCNYIEQKAEHTPSDWIVDSTPTETEKGSKHIECTVCKYVMQTEEILVEAKYSYEFTQGKHSEWEQDSENGLSFIVDGDFDKFVSVMIDGKVIDQSDYTVKKGITAIILKAEYLKTLSAGKYTIEIVFGDTSATTDLTILKSINAGVSDNITNNNSPQTGDSSNSTLWIFLMLSSACIIMVLLVSSRRYKGRTFNK